MDLTTCKSILSGGREKKIKFNDVIIFRTFKVVVDKVVDKKKGNWAQILLNFDFRSISWDWSRFQSILLLFSSLPLFSDLINYPCSVTTVLQQVYISELCDIFVVDLITVKEWSPLQWRAVHNMSRIVSLSPVSKQSIMLYALTFIKRIPDVYESHWIQNCASFCHSVTTAAFLCIEIYQANEDQFRDNVDFLKTLISLVFYFDSYKLGNPVDKDVLEKVGTAESNLVPTSVPMTWSTQLVTKLVTFLLRIFRQNYTNGAKVPMDHALLGLDYPGGHVQTLSLMLILCHLKAIPTELAASKPVQKTMDDTKASKSGEKQRGKLKQQVKKVRNALKLQDAVKKRKSPYLRACESLCQSGHIRKIYWCLLNECFNVRALALEVLSTFEFILDDEMNDQSSSWQSHIIELGLVPLLELVSCGFPVASIKEISADETSKMHFPERKIRLFAGSLLSKLATVAVGNVSLQDKLILSLIHTKNTSIRGNILTGFMFLSPRHLDISKFLMRSSKSESGSTKSIFVEMLSEIYVEESLHDLKNVLKIIHHFFLNRHRQLEQVVAKSKPVNIKKDSRVMTEKLSASTEILIRDKFNGSLVKMQCPDKKTLKTHSSRLFATIESVGSRPDPNSKDGNLAILPGHYHVWQEIFSHMIDDYIMDTTLAATGVAEIMELYEYSCEYELTHLCMRYTKELVKRLSSESFVQIFQCSIKMLTESCVQGGSSSLDRKIDASALDLQSLLSKLSLCCHSVRFFIEKLSKVSTPQNLQRKLLISEALELYFQYFFLFIDVQYTIS